MRFHLVAALPYPVRAQYGVESWRGAAAEHGVFGDDPWLWLARLVKGIGSVCSLLDEAECKVVVSDVGVGVDGLGRQETRRVDGGASAERNHVRLVR